MPSGALIRKKVIVSTLVYKAKLFLLIILQACICFPCILPNIILNLRLPESHYKRLETKLNEVAGTIIVTLKAITDHKTDFVRQQDFLVCGEIKEFISRYWKTTFDLRFRGQSYHTDDPAFNDCTYNKDTSEFSPWFSTEKFKYDEMVARFHGNILYLSEIFVTLASISLGNYR